MAEKNSAQTNKPTDTTKIIVTWPWTNCGCLVSWPVYGIIVWSLHSGLQATTIALSMTTLMHLVKTVVVNLA